MNSNSAELIGSHATYLQCTATCSFSNTERQRTTHISQLQFCASVVCRRQNEQRIEFNERFRNSASIIGLQRSIFVFWRRKPNCFINYAKLMLTKAWINMQISQYIECNRICCVGLKIENHKWSCRESSFRCKFLKLFLHFKLTTNIYLKWKTKWLFETLIKRSSQMVQWKQILVYGWTTETEHERR